MNTYLWSFWAVLRRRVIELKRYAFNTFSSVATIYLVFLLMFLGARFVAGPGEMFGETLEGLIVGFSVWTFAIIAYSEMSWAVMQEAQQGTLEQLYMTPAGFGWVALSLAVSSFLASFAFVVPIVVLMMVTTGRYLRLDMLSLLPLLTLTLPAVYGIGLAMAGLALVFKRIQAMFQILQFVFVAFLFVPAEPLWAKALPLTWGAQLIRRVVVGGERLTEIPGADIAWLAAGSVLWVTLGIAAFTVCERTARRRGLLGHY